MCRRRPRARASLLRHRRAGRTAPELRRVLLALVVPLTGCAGPQSALAPKGPVAEATATLTWILFAGGLAILTVVMGAVLYAMFRAPHRRVPLPAVPFLIGAGLIFPTAALTALIVYGTDVGRRITQPAERPLPIEVTGHRWWWEVRYPAYDGLPEVVTSNELRLPVGAPVELVLESADVVHSFWIPNLGGKIDMIPGRTNVLRLHAAEPGNFRGQCAEFCGAEHAHMGFIAIAEPEQEFSVWRRARAADALVTSGAALQLFLERGCGACHTLAGTAARGTAGPVLTHFAARPTLGAARIANTPRALRAWLADHGATLKPRSLGPEPRELDAGDVESLAALLEQLD